MVVSDAIEVNDYYLLHENKNFWTYCFRHNLRAQYCEQYGPNIVSALPLLKLLDILTVENAFCFSFLKLTYQWHKVVFTPIILDTQLKKVYTSHGYAQI